MNANERLYFGWLCGFVNGNDVVAPRYERLMYKLFTTHFISKIFLDTNREAAGLALRERFKNEYYVEDILQGVPCTILELMIALSMDCELHIMRDDDVGDRVAQWFWEMVVSLGLGTMSDESYDETYVDNVLKNFISRKYSPTGQGGLFYIPDCRVDLTKVEIWYQMLWYNSSRLSNT